MAVLFVDGHLPESGGEVDRCKDVGVGSADVADAFVDFFHGIFVRVGLFVETSEVLHNSKATPPLSLEHRKWESCRRIWFVALHRAEAILSTIAPQMSDDQV